MNRRSGFFASIHVWLLCLLGCTSLETIHQSVVDSNQRLIFGTPPSDAEVSLLAGTNVCITFIWEAPSSILQSLMVIGILAGFDDSNLFLVTSDGRDGAFLTEAYWNLLLERQRVSIEDPTTRTVRVPRRWVGHLFRTKVNEPAGQPPGPKNDGVPQ